MFHGSESISVDSKGRLSIPTKFRESIMAACEGRIVVTANPDLRCLFLYPHHIWEEKIAQTNKFKNRNTKAGRLQRIFSAYSVPHEMDPSNGRVSLSQTQRKYADIDDKIMLMGVGDRFEIWNESLWEQYMGLDLGVSMDIDGEDESEEMADFSF